MLYALTFVRLVTPLYIFKKPVRGILLSLIWDSLDWEILLHFNLEIPAFYQQWDKALDIYLSFVFTIYLLGTWKDRLSKKVGVFLFSWRFLGVLVFLFTLSRPILFLFPNLFDSFFILVELFKNKLKNTKVFVSNTALIMCLAILLIFKLLQEYTVHISQTFPWQLKFGQFFAPNDTFYNYLNIGIWSTSFIAIQVLLMWLVISRSLKNQKN